MVQDIFGGMLARNGKLMLLSKRGYPDPSSSRSQKHSNISNKLARA